MVFSFQLLIRKKSVPPFAANPERRTGMAAL
jgi:hypothetical protein